MVAIGHQCLPGTFYMNISGSILHSARESRGHCWGLPQPVALASAVNLFSSNTDAATSVDLAWLCICAFSPYPEWGATLSCLPKDARSRGTGMGLARVAQAAAHAAAPCFQELCCLPHSPPCPQASQRPWESTGRDRVVN